MGCHSLLRGIFPTQGSNPGLSRRRQILYCLSHQGSPSHKSKAKQIRSVVSDSLRPHGLRPTRLLCPWGFPGKGTGVSSHFLLQGIFPTQGLNPGVLHCRQTLYPLSPQGSPPHGDPLTVTLYHTTAPPKSHPVWLWGTHRRWCGGWELIMAWLGSQRGGGRRDRSGKTSQLGHSP